MDNSQFDQWLRSKMSRLEGEIPPADWERMNERLNEEDWIDAQNEQAADFDQAIRQSMSNTPPPAPANWDFMAEKLDQEFGPESLNDIILDGVVYEQLHQYQAPYNAEHWPIMEERIKESYSIRRKLVKYKVVEVSLMLLLIFTLLQFLPHYPAKKKAVETNNHQSQPFVANVLPVPSFETDQPVLNTAVSQKEISSSSQAEQTNKPNLSDQSTVLNTSENKIIPPAATGENNLNTTTDQTITKQSIAKVSSTLANDQKISLSIESLETIDPSLITTPSSFGFTQTSILSSFDMLTLLAAEQLPTPEKILPDCVICPKIPRGKSWQVGMIVATDMNYINPTEAEFRLRLPDYDEMNTGYGGGLTVTIPVTNRWAFETGLIYASAYYLPNEINASLQGSFVGGFSAVGFQSAQLHMLKVPFQAQYSFNLNNSRWKWYGVMGASVNATMIQEYYYRSIPEPSFLGNTSSPRSSNLAAELSDEFKGLLDKGQVDDNLQITANIGVGVERYFSPRWSIFIQPVYQHDLRLQSLQGFGPYQDRINSLSFYFGSKVTLK